MHIPAPNPFSPFSSSSSNRKLRGTFAPIVAGGASGLAGTPPILSFNVVMLDVTSVAGDVEQECCSRGDCMAGSCYMYFVGVVGVSCFVCRCPAMFHRLLPEAVAVASPELQGTHAWMKAMILHTYARRYTDEKLITLGM